MKKFKITKNAQISKFGNNQNRSKDSSMEEVGVGGKWGKVWARGKEPLKNFALGAAIGLACCGAYYWIRDWFNKSKSKTRQEENTSFTKDAINLANAKSGNAINEHHEASHDTMAEDDNSTDNKIRLAQATSVIRMEERKQVLVLRQSAKESAITNSTKKKISLKEWINYFHSKCSMPDYSSIPFLASILDGCPDDYKDAMLLHSNTELAALCFSKVRAKYLDGQMHSPSLQTIVEGEFGSGKAKFLQLHKTLFQRIIDKDAAKMVFQSKGTFIIQTAGINISQSKFFDVLAYNQGVHTCIIETEAATVEKVFKTPNGLGFDCLRMAFHNEPIYRNLNKGKKTRYGSFPVYLNYTITGTPKAVSSLIDEKEVEGGTASRICFTVIPEVGRKIPAVAFPEGDDLEAMRDQIDIWRDQYCYKTDCNCDIACDETIICLDYICDALKEWLDEQYDLAMEEGNAVRKDVRARMATIAFHNAIVLHMLAGEPSSTDRKLRKTVRDLTIYIANYCMERYLTKFSDYVPQTPFNETSAEETSSANPTLERRRLTQEEVDEWYYLRGTYDDDGEYIGLGYIAKRLGVTKYSVKNSFDRYEKKQGIKK